MYFLIVKFRLYYLKGDIDIVLEYIFLVKEIVMKGKYVELKIILELE